MGQPFLSPISFGCAKEIGSPSGEKVSSKHRKADKMIVIYNASNSIEAHLIKNLLEQQEIPAYVFGDYLQGGVGEIPAIGLVTVNVSDLDYTKAKEVLDAWGTSKIVENIDENYMLSPTHPRG
ncbi:MAG: DUF2007 domain-containing protein [Pseudomonadota bacterium]